MQEFNFEATGTKWGILVDGDVPQGLFAELCAEVESFESLYSRFKDDSIIGKLNVVGRLGEEQRVVVSDELGEMLRFGEELRELTKGAFDLNVAELLEGYGYDASYAFEMRKDLIEKERGFWGVEELYAKTFLWTKGYVSLDLGAFGKGRLIDKLADRLREREVRYYLVDGGRDFWGTEKSDGSAWRIALEHPFDANLAIGEFELKNCALACSGISQRKIKEFHHFMDLGRRAPISQPVGVFVSAKNAMTADGVSTAVAVSSESYWSVLMDKYGVRGAVVRENGELVDFGLEGVYR
jgi:thiamine biosynthesis lipoprotein